MLYIPCPWCGLRDETEFTCGGEAHLKRPKNPAKTNDEEWNDYLFMRKNPKGEHHELWYHSYGCRRWFNVARDTVSYQILASYKLDETYQKGGDDAA